MKRSFLAICFGTLFFVGCKEVPPSINFGVGAAISVDTTYVVSPVPVADAHNVLVEEFTGQSCSNCPQGHATLDTAAVHNPGRVNVVALFEKDNSTVTNPPTGAVYDLRTITALLIGNSAIYNSIPALPNAGIDRIPVSGNTIVGESLWPGTINTRLAVPDSLNLSITSSYNTAAGVDTIIATITYTQAVSTSQNLSIVVVEDSIVDLQEEPFGIIDSTYMFNDVFRGMVTSVPLGDPILDTMTTKEAGRLVRRLYTYKLPAVTPASNPAINPGHCRVIAFINSPGTNGDYRIIQSEQTKMTH